MIAKTKDCARPPAAICRENGWGVGTRLEGDEGYGPTVIEITAVGLEHILAFVVTQNGEPWKPSESLWVLDCRDWKKV